MIEKLGPNAVIGNLFKLVCFFSLIRVKHAVRALTDLELSSVAGGHDQNDEQTGVGGQFAQSLKVEGDFYQVQTPEINIHIHIHV